MSAMSRHSVAQWVQCRECALCNQEMVEDGHREGEEGEAGN